MKLRWDFVVLYILSDFICDDRLRISLDGKEQLIREERESHDTKYLKRKKK